MTSPRQLTSFLSWPTSRRREQVRVPRFCPRSGLMREKYRNPEDRVLHVKVHGELETAQHQAFNPRYSTNWRFQTDSLLLKTLSRSERDQPHPSERHEYCLPSIRIEPGHLRIRGVRFALTSREQASLSLRTRCIRCQATRAERRSCAPPNLHRNNCLAISSRPIISFTTIMLSTVSKPSLGFPLLQSTFLID